MGRVGADLTRDAAGWARAAGLPPLQAPFPSLRPLSGLDARLPSAFFHTPPPLPAPFISPGIALAPSRLGLAPIATT